MEEFCNESIKCLHLLNDRSSWHWNYAYLCMQDWSRVCLMTMECCPLNGLQHCLYMAIMSFNEHYLLPECVYCFLVEHAVSGCKHIRILLEIHLKYLPKCPFSQSAPHLNILRRNAPSFVCQTTYHCESPPICTWQRPSTQSLRGQGSSKEAWLRHRG